VQHNTAQVKERRRVIRQYAIAYCEGKDLTCRPKHGTLGVMFLQGDWQWWTHLTEEEFHAVFNELERGN
jgi:hypothetical protein